MKKVALAVLCVCNGTQAAKVIFQNDSDIPAVMYVYLDGQNKPHRLSVNSSSEKIMLDVGKINKITIDGKDKEEKLRTIVDQRPEHRKYHAYNLGDPTIKFYLNGAKGNYTLTQKWHSWWRWEDMSFNDRPWKP